MRKPGPWTETTLRYEPLKCFTYSGPQTREPGLYQVYDYSRYFYKTRSGFNSTEWRPKLRLGILSPTPYSLTKEVLVQAPETFGEYFERSYPNISPWPKYPMYRCLGSGLGAQFTYNELDGVFGSETAKVQNAALTRLYKKIGGVNFDSLTFIGEAKETQAMIRTGANRIGRSVLAFEQATREKTLRLGKFSKISHMIDFATNEWLEFQYGIKPLIGDLHNAIDAYSQPEALLEFQLLRAHADMVLSKTYKIPLVLPIVPMPAGVFYSRTDTRVIDVFCGVRAQTSLRPQGNPNWGLTWNNVLPAAWELIPYSFLIDYFTNVGDIIQAYTAPRAGLSNYWMTTVFTDTRVWHGTRWNQQGPQSGWWRGYVSSGKAEAISMTRAVSSLPLPSLSFSSWDDLSLTKQVSVGALLTQFVSRKASSFGFLVNRVNQNIF